MNEIIKHLLTPAVFLAAVGLLIQAIFGIINTWQQIKARKPVKDANQINYTVSLIQIIDGLPFSDGEKINLKLKTADEILPKGLPENLRQKIGEQLKDEG